MQFTGNLALFTRATPRALNKSNKMNTNCHHCHEIGLHPLVVHPFIVHLPGVQ